MHLDGGAVAEVKAVGGFALNQLGEHRDAREQGAHISEYDAGLLAVGRYDEHGAAPTRRQVAAIVKEARKKNGAKRKDEALAGTPTADKPSLG
jgi:hypothetical protein